MEPQNRGKRRREVSSDSSSSTDQSPNSLPNVTAFNQSQVDSIITSFLSLPHVLLSPSSLSIESSIDRVLEELYKTTGDDSFQGPITVHTEALASLLQKSTKKSFKKYAALFNSKSWPLPHELSVKVFSKLDTESLVQASACCTMFEKFVKDPRCYSHIDLTIRDVHDSVVSRMISHAGDELRSLKIGRMARPYEIRSSMLTGACFTPLYDIHPWFPSVDDNGALKRNLVKILHIYSSRWINEKYIHFALSACPNVTDLKIVGLNGTPLDMLVHFLPTGCEHLFIEKEDNGSGESRYLHYSVFGTRWPNITSLSLIGYKINDRDAYHLIMGLRKLKYMDLSRADEINGSFFRDIKYYCKATLLETLILRDCSSLQKRYVCQFLDSLIRGHFGFIRHIDVSSIHGLICDGMTCNLICDGLTCNEPKFPLEELKEKRPGLTFVAGSPSSSSSSSSLSSSSSEDSSYSESEDEDSL